MKKRLYRSRKDKMLAGICGGLAEYFAVDPSLVRIACVLLCLYAGTGLYRRRQRKTCRKLLSDTDRSEWKSDQYTGWKQL